MDDSQIEETAHNISASALEAALHELSTEEEKFVPTLSVVSEFQGSKHRTLRIEDLAASAKPDSTKVDELSQYPLQESKFSIGTGKLSLSQGPLLDETEISAYKTPATRNGNSVSPPESDIKPQGSLALSQYPLDDTTKASILIDNNILSENSLNTFNSLKESQNGTYSNVGLSQYRLGETGIDHSGASGISASQNTATDSDTTHSTIIHAKDGKPEEVSEDEAKPKLTDDIKPDSSHAVKDQVTILSSEQRQELFYSLTIDDTTMASKINSTMTRSSLDSQQASTVVEHTAELSSSVRSDPDPLLKSTRDNLASSAGSTKSAPGAYETTKQFTLDHGNLLRPRSFNQDSDDIYDLERQSDASVDSGLDNFSDRINAIMSEAPINKRKEMIEDMEGKTDDNLDSAVKEMLQKPRQLVAMPESPGSDASGFTNHSRASTEYQDLPSKITVDPQLGAIPEAFRDRNKSTPSQQGVAHDSADDSPGVSSDVEAILKKYAQIEKSKTGDNEELNNRDRLRTQSEISESSEKTDDVLGERVRHLLEEKAYQQKGEEWAGASKLDYSGVAKDLDDIQSHLSMMRKDEVSFHSSSSITSHKTDQDEEKKKYSWDYGADIGYNPEGRFVSSTRPSSGCSSRVGGDGQSTRPPMHIQPLLTSDIVPLDVALDIMQATEEAIERGEFDKSGRKLESDDVSRRISDGTVTGSDTTIAPLTTQDLSVSQSAGDLSRSRSHLSKGSDLDFSLSDLSRSRSYISRHSEVDLDQSSSGIQSRSRLNMDADSEIKDLSGRNDSQLSDYKYRSLSASPSINRYPVVDGDPSFHGTPESKLQPRSRSVDPNVPTPLQPRVTSHQSPVRSQSQTGTLSDRVYNILTSSSPHRQAYRYLQEAEQKEATLEMEKRNRWSGNFKVPYQSDSHLKSPERKSYNRFDFDKYGTQQDSPRKNLQGFREDSFKTLSPDRSKDHHSFTSPMHARESYTGVTPVSYKPFSAFNQVEDFLAKQMDKMADTTFDRSMDVGLGKAKEREQWATPKQTRTSPAERYTMVDSYTARGTSFRDSPDYGAGATYRPR